MDEVGTFRRIARRVAVAVMVAGAVLAFLSPSSTAHTCMPDPWIGVGGRLLLPRASGLGLVELPNRVVRDVPILPSQGVVSSVARAPDGSRLAVARFWRRPADQVGGQDILIVGPEGGAPEQVLVRGTPGEQLGSPTWMPDGSLVFERQLSPGAITSTRIEQRGPDDGLHILAEQAFAPTVSPDGERFAFIRPTPTDRLMIGDLAGGTERVLVDDPSFLSLAFPRFSPDGTWIAFAAVGDSAVGLAPLALGAAPGPGSVRHARLPMERARPASGVGVGAVAWAHGIPWDVWIVRADGSERRRVTHFYDDDPSAAWSPDGRWLAIFSGEALHVVAVEGPANYCVAAEGGYGTFEWLP